MIPGKTCARARKRASLTAALAVSLFADPIAAYAVDGTWVGGASSDWTNAANWSSNPSVPDGTATFTSTGNTTVSSSGLVTIGEVNFTATPNALAYTISEGDFFLVNGAGIFNNSTNTQTFNISAGMVFQNSSTASGGTKTVTYSNSASMSFFGTSTAGSATINNAAGDMEFNENSTAGSAAISNGAVVNFQDSSSAGSANITNTASGTIAFNTMSSAGTATIGNAGSLSFNNQSTAGSAAITNSSGATLTFNDMSTAGSAQIGSTLTTVTFNDSSSAGNATFIASGLGNTITFNNTSTAASANIALVGATLTFNDASTAGSAIITMPNVMHPGSITFNGTSSAGNANITNVAVTALGTSVQFLDASTAGSATITNNPNSSVPNSGGVLNFGTLGGTDTANAGTATIINNQFGATSFLADTSAMGATITNNAGGNTNFQDQSTASGATIINDGGTTNFGVPLVGTDTATAGNANITNNSGGTTNFNASTTAASATITSNSGGSVFFFDSSTGGTARFIINTGGTFDMSGLTTTGMTAGSIEGAGNYFLGSKMLTVGGNNLSTTVSGVISDGGGSGGTGGSLVKVGTGTLILSGPNTYTGGTTISAGTLQLGNGGASGSIVGNVVDNSVFAFNRSDAFAFGGGISGTGSVIQIGPGTLTLTAANNYSGGTTVSGGTLAIAADNNIGTGPLALLAGTTLQFTQSFTFTHPTTVTGDPTVNVAAGNTNTMSGVIADGGAPGDIIKTGAGILIFTANNTYTGGTTISAGTLQLGNGGTSGSIVGDVVNNATLVVNRSDALTLSGNVSGTGAFQQAGTGTTTFTGTNTYTGGTTISAGMLQLGNGGTSGSIVGNVVDNGTLTFNRSNTYTFGGAISGSGTVNQNGSGTTALTGASTYTGPTNVNAGILSVDGSLTSTVFVNSGGTLMGNGTVGGLNVASGGTVAPGHSIGQINVAGNVSFASGSTYQVEANAAGQSDKIVATGTATLTGGTVQALFAVGNYGTTKYTILTANGGVSGTFANVTSNMAFLMPSLSYDADDVFLNLTRASFSSVAQTFNQRAVAGALDAGPFGALGQAILPLSVPQALQAFDALSGEIHGSLQTSLIDDSRYIRNAILGRLRTAGYAGAGGGMAPLAFGGPEMTTNGAQAAIAEAAPDTQASAYGMVTKAPVYKAPPSYDPDLTFWAQGYGAWGRYDGDGNAARMDRSAGGAFVGVDRRFGDIWRLGFAAGYSRSDISVDARASSADVDTFHAAVYAGAAVGPWSLRTGAAFAWHDIDTSRAIVFPGFFDTAQASYHGSTSQVFGEVGYGMAFGQVAVEPFAGMAYVHLETNGFSEIGGIGGSAALTGSGNSEDVGFSSLGVRFATSVMLGNGMMVIPRASVAWQHAFGDVTPSAVLAFESTGVAFDIHGVPLARDSALVEAGFDVKIAPKITLGIAYTGELASAVQDHAVKGKFTWAF
jgi:outer membrane autotransporter protein